MKRNRVRLPDPTCLGRARKRLEEIEAPRPLHISGCQAGRNDPEWQQIVERRIREHQARIEADLARLGFHPNRSEH